MLKKRKFSTEQAGNRNYHTPDYFAPRQKDARSYQGTQNLEELYGVTSIPFKKGKHGFYMTKQLEEL